MYNNTYNKNNIYNIVTGFLHDITSRVRLKKNVLKEHWCVYISTQINTRVSVVCSDSMKAASYVRGVKRIGFDYICSAR